MLFAFISSGVTLFNSSCPWLITHKTVKFESKVACRDGGVGSILLSVHLLVMLQVFSELCRRLWSSWGCNRKHWCLDFQGKNVVKITVTESVSMGGPESMWLPEKSVCSDGWWAALATVKRLGKGCPGLYFCLLSGQMLSGSSSVLHGFAIK